ncbi:hypothetical protein mRhiFer1_009225 [Rhinolophus ferrumequinum]|uniref:non-specific serine/threonine protein kinase n=1 Tax=Rhinolophus ferrumequinum TaxID=59479 RepID=A0A7J7S7T6_RHIFE|nr:hypothetical protein mRhiFer1_009225 [Rhinolophus ferrumequinum]
MLHDFTDILVDQEPHSAYYELQGTIGKGTFAKVVLGKHILMELKVAVKIIDQRVFYGMRRSLLQEVHCMADLKHANIVQLFHVISIAESLFLVMELVPRGDMLRYLYDHGRMSEDKARGVFQQLVSAVHYCHEKGIAHRDLKPQKCAVRHSAPELFLGQTYEGRAVDIWSLGVLRYKMLTNTVSFKAMDWGELRQKVVSGQYVVPSYLCIEVENFQKNC